MQTLISLYLDTILWCYENDKISIDDFHRFVSLLHDELKEFD